jgi:hypothetical protein
MAIIRHACALMHQHRPAWMAGGWEPITVGTAAAARLGRKRRGRAELNMRTLLNGAALRVALVARIKGTVNSRETRRSAGHGSARMDT